MTRAETALVVEKGLTVQSKSMKEHLEATNHLMREGYPIAIIRKEDRLAYINSLEKAQKGGA